MRRKVNQGNNRVRHTIAGIFLAVGCLAMALCMSACGGGQGIEVTIQDGMNETVVTARVGETVEDILAAAEITIGEKDVVTPDMEYKVTSSDHMIWIDRYASVTVLDGEDIYEVELTGGTVQDALDVAGIELGENDTVDQELDSYLTDGMEITVERCRTVTLTIDGESEEVMTGASTVQGLIDEMEIDIGEDDEISPEPDTAIEEGMEIVINRSYTEEVVVTEEIPYETTYQNSSDLYTGETSVSQAGVNGEKTVTYIVTYVGGREVGHEEVSEEVTKEPVNEIILQGTKEKQTSSSGSSSSSSSGSSSGSSSSSSSGSSSSSSSSSSSGSSSSSSSGSSSEHGAVVTQQTFYDCDGSGHGYYEIQYEDGYIDYIDF